MSRRFFAGLLLALPWIQPFAPGPSPNVVPWLVSAACALGAFLLLPGTGVPRKVLIATSLVVFYVVVRPTAAIDRAAFAGGCALVLLAFGIGRAAADDEALVDALAAAWVVAAGVSALLALLQYFDLAAFLHQWVAAARPGEAVGNLRQRNQLASLTSIGLAAALWLAARTDRPRRIGAAAAAIVLLAIADAATTSRTGLLEWVVILALVAFWQGPGGARSVRLASLGVVVYALATWSLPILLEHMTGVAADSMLARLEANLGCSSRRVLWTDVLQLIPQHPWVGWGWGELDYAHYMHLYGDTPRFCDILDNAHNLPLHVAVELGVPAALLLCAALAIGFVRARPWREVRAARQLAWLVVSVIALHSLVEYPLWYGPFQIALGLALGMLRASGGESVRLSPATRALVAIPIVAALAYTAWDYDRVSQIYLEPEQRRPQWRDHTLADVHRSWLFASQARFAELTLADVTSANAAWVETTARQMLHYSPEPRVIERLVESATLRGHDDEAVLQLARFRAAFPVEYAKWRAEHLGAKPARSPG